MTGAAAPGGTLPPAAVPKGPRDTCYACRAGQHEVCTERRTTLCACNHREHASV